MRQFTKTPNCPNMNKIEYSSGWKEGEGEGGRVEEGRGGVCVRAVSKLVGNLLAVECGSSKTERNTHTYRRIQTH